MADQKRALDRATEPQRKVTERDPGYGGAPGAKGPWGQRRGPHAYGNQVLDRILAAYGNDANQVEVIGPDGKPQKLDTTNQDQINKLASGEYKWRHKGDTGGGITMANTPEEMGSGFSTDHPDKSGRAAAEASGTAGYGSGGSSSSGVRGNVQIDLTDQAKQLLQVVGPNPTPLTPNQIAANAGRGTAADNNPPPGDAPVRRGLR
jgi:hypothetical protein